MSINDAIHIDKVSAGQVQAKEAAPLKGTFFGHNVSFEIKGKTPSADLIRSTLANATVGKTTLKGGVVSTSFKHRNVEIIVRYNDSRLKTELEGLKNKKLDVSQRKTDSLFTSVVSKISKVFSSDKPQKLTETDLAILGKINSPEFKNNVPPQFVKDLAGVMNKSIGNPAVNKQMTEILAKGNSPIAKEVLQMMREFSFRTHNCEDAGKIVDRTEKLMLAVRYKQEIADSDKLSLNQLGKIESLVKAEEAFKFIKDLGLDKAEPALGQLLTSFEKADRVIDQIELMMQRYSNLKSGDLAFQNIEKINQFRNRETKFEDAFETMVIGMPLHHAAVNFKNNDGEDVMSHVHVNYTHEESTLYDKATQSFYRLDAARLLTQDPDMIGILQEMYKEGKGYVAAVREGYQTSQAELHKSGKNYFDQIENDPDRRQKSGLASLFSFLQKSQKPSPGKMELLKKEMLAGHLKNSKMICSEFAAKTMVSGLLIQEDKLKADMIQFLVEKRGLSEEEAKKWVIPQDLFQVPIDAKESLSRITPPRLIEILSKTGSINRVQPHPLLQQLVKADDLKIDAKEEVIPLPEISGFTVDEKNKKEMIADLPPKPAPRAPKDNKLASRWNDFDGKIFATRLNRALGKEKLEDEKTLEPALYRMIGKRRAEMKQIKENWRPSIGQTDANSVMDAPGSTLSPIDEGQGGAFMLSNRSGHIEWVVKPLGNQILELDNMKALASPIGEDPVNPNTANRVRRTVPLYSSPQTEVLAYEAARVLGFTGITPKTELAIIKSDAFGHVLKGTEEERNNNPHLALAGEADTEKLCSVQQFTANVGSLERLTTFELKENMAPSQMNHYLETMIDPSDFEQCFLYACITGETDGNPGNYLLTKKIDDQGNERRGFVKIDNSLTFPEGNYEFDHCLDEFPQMGNALSPQGRAAIANMDEAAILNLIDKYIKSPKAQEAFRVRVAVLKELVKQENVTLADINKAFLELKESSRPRRAELEQRAPAAPAPEAASGTMVVNTGTIVVNTGTMVVNQDKLAESSNNLAKNAEEAMEPVSNPITPTPRAPRTPRKAAQEDMIEQINKERHSLNGPQLKEKERVDDRR